MPDVIFSGPAGRIEGRYQPGTHKEAPIAIILHPHPKHGGTMNNKIVYALHKSFMDQGFATLRFNFRGVGKSEGVYAGGEGELADAAAALDWIQLTFPAVRNFWVAGFSFGAWVSMQLLMRRPELEGFIAISPPANKYDFSFLAPCPVSGLIVQGDADPVVTPKSVDALVAKLNLQKNIKIDYRSIENADHFFTNNVGIIYESATQYLNTLQNSFRKSA
jgi:alpha/beta superfamily hydrolase